jgi:transcriptional regulator with PAS, ATPase and Fis domain
LGTLVEGIITFSHEGRFLAANRSAQFQLGLSLNALRAHTFSSLFGIAMSRLLDLCSGNPSAAQQLCLHNGVSVWSKVKVKPVSKWFAGQGPGNFHDHAVLPPELPQSAPLSPRKAHMSNLHYLDTGDPLVSAVINKLNMVCGRDIPIMLLGETGTGKDLVAQAIHKDSDRAGQAFVSVNCASIPETLIESELFGYEEGAFTGARRKGAVGKIQQAHGGTLFLDEIGDMPRHLQARLLRVLQDRKVNPLGAGKEVEVDIAIICATNKNLKTMIAQGEFREDLYYRLNGLVVRLPALRGRTDFDLVIKKILGKLCGNGPQIGVSSQVMALFQAYSWPGNFRQLHNLLRTAVVMAGCQGIIERSHLPDDFLEDCAELPAPAAPPVMYSAAADPASVAGADHPSDGGSLQDVALSTMAQMLRLHKGNVSAAAKALGVSRNTVYRKKEQLPPDVWH